MYATLPQLERLQLEYLTLDFNLRIKPLSASITNETHEINLQSSICYVKDFSLPQNLLLPQHKFNNNNIYDAIFLTSGNTKHVNAYIIDPVYYYKDENINVYHWQLPSFSNKTTGRCIEYSQKYGLIAIGNVYQYTQSGFNILRFDEKNYNNSKEWYWKESSLEKKRSYALAKMITDDKLILCGGL